MSIRRPYLSTVAIRQDETVLRSNGASVERENVEYFTFSTIGLQLETLSYLTSYKSATKIYAIVNIEPSLTLSKFVTKSSLSLIINNICSYQSINIQNNICINDSNYVLLFEV